VDDGRGGPVTTGSLDLRVPAFIAIVGARDACKTLLLQIPCGR
jgi:hypothetical protein